MRVRRHLGVAGVFTAEARSATARRVSWPLGRSGHALVGSTRTGPTTRTGGPIVRTVQDSRWASTEALGIPIGTGATLTRTTTGTTLTRIAGTTDRTTA